MATWLYLGVLLGVVVVVIEYARSGRWAATWLGIFYFGILAAVLAGVFIYMRAT